MDTIARGNATEAAVLAAFVRRDWAVWTPFGDGSPFDLVVGRGVSLLRVQCKSGRSRDGCLRFNAYATDHGRGRRSYRGRADLFGVFLPGAGDVFVIPVMEAPIGKGYFRLEPARNGQRKRIRLAEPYRIENWDPDELVQRSLGAGSGEASN